MLDGFLFSLPTPSSINYFWGLGSILGGCLVLQVASGFFLSLFYSCSSELSFGSVVTIIMDVEYGWLVRLFHSSGASLFILFLYIHVFRGILFGSFKIVSVWLVGVIILVLASVVSFLGYVLPWGQMSFWAATVITSMVTALPIIGDSVSWWLWGSYSVCGSTLVRFFSFHYMLSLLVVGMSVVHLINLHEGGSSNPSGCSSPLDNVIFHPLFSYKDLSGLVVMAWLYLVGVLVVPHAILGFVNWQECDYLTTPVHIKPEWYFLYAYCILRSVDSKVGGVILMALSLLILILLSVCGGSMVSAPLVAPILPTFSIFWLWSFCWLSYLGGCYVEYPFDVLGKVFTWVYFISILSLSSFIYNPYLGTWITHNCD